MKINKLTFALAAVGLISLASAAQAQTIVYLTGSTAARQAVFNALTATGGQVFTNTYTGKYPAAETGSDNIFAVEGNVYGLGDTIFNCSFTGSEAGIAAVANQPLTQTLPDDPNGPGPYALPGTPMPSYLTGATLAAMTGATATHASDLSMADTSQAVSRTPIAVASLHPFGIVGVITFTYMKGYDSSPDAANGRLTNVPVNTAYNNLLQGDNLNACNYTGNTNDISDGVAMVGRNFGSGTRANELLTAALYPIRGTVKQYAFGTGAQLYPSGTPGVLTFSGSYASGQTLTYIGDDGFDSGKGVRQEMQTDWTGQGVIGVGFMGISDAKSAALASDQGGNHYGTYLTYDGVYESDAATITGAYPIWGTEWCYGQVTPSAAALSAGAALVSGVKANVAAIGLQAVGHDVRNNDSSYIIPISVMQVTRSHTDSGFPVQCAAGAF